MTIPTLERDRGTGRMWLTFFAKPGPETIAALKAAGWRWGSYRKAWFHPSRFALPPAGLEYEQLGEVAFAAERAERLEERAEAAGARADAAFEKAHAAVAGIEPGQPILVGHHSERHHRRALEKHDAAMSKACAESDKARRLAAAAAGSAHAAARRHDPGAISRRLAKLRKDLAAYERPEATDEAGVAQYHAAVRLFRGASWTLEEARAELLTRVAERARRAEILREEIAGLETELAAAGGLPADHLDLHPGDIVQVRGHAERIVKVNRKTITVAADIIAPGWTLKYDLSFVEAVLKRAEPPAPTPETAPLVAVPPRLACTGCGRAASCTIQGAGTTMLRCDARVPPLPLTPAQKAAQTRRARRTA